MHERILAAAEKRIHYNIQWTNRDDVWTVDGSTFHNHGLGYGFGGDDIEEFKASLDWQHSYYMLWSNYACALEPEDKAGFGGHRRPGGRPYCSYDCEPMGGPNPCSEVDCNIPAGYEGSNCRWYWTGAQCNVYTIYTLQEADSRFDYLSPTTECQILEPSLINNGQGEIVDRFFAEVGDLVFMDYYNDEDGPYAHVGILSYKGSTIQDDCVLGCIG